MCLKNVRMRLVWPVSLATMTIALAMLAGCGGGGSAGDSAVLPELDGPVRGVSVTIDWPQPEDRVIPNSTRWIELVLSGNGLTLPTETIQRSDVQNGQATRTVTGMPAGRYTLSIAAKASSDGALDVTVVAQGSGSVVVPESGLGRATVALSHTEAGRPTVLAQAPSAAKVNDVLGFEGSATDHGGSLSSITRYEWDFGDGSTHFVSTSTASTTHAYLTAGTYTARLTATDNDGLTGAAQFQVTIADETVQLVRFQNQSNQTVPTDNVQGQVIIVSQVLSERPVTNVEVYVDGQLEGRDSTASSGQYAVAYDSRNDSNGQHTLRLVANMQTAPNLQSEMGFVVNNGGTPPGPTAVQITPPSASLQPGGQQQFTANLAVAWSIVEQSAGGTITQGGLYTAPGTPGTYHVRAIDDSDPSNEAQATVTVTAAPVVSVSIDPKSVTLATGGTQQFTATVTGTSNTAVTWSKTGGTVSDSGLYTAPATAGTYEVTATSDEDDTKSATATVTVTSGGNGSDGAELILIPAGNFTMGGSNGTGYTDEDPQRTIYLDAYRIHKYEVTNAQYAAFLNAAQPSSSELSSWIYFDGGTYQKIRNNSGSYSVLSGWEDHPVVYVLWYGAQAYADHYGMLLPTEAQWEKAARGSSDDRQYPWGDTWDRDRVNAYGTSGSDTWSFTSPVGSFPSGASPYGLMDMAGNVWEWCRDWYRSDWYSVMPASNPVNESSGSSRVLRGGSWGDSGTVYFRVALRGWYNPDGRNNGYNGFRCSAAP